MKPTIAVTASTPEKIQTAKALALKLGLVYLPNSRSDYDFLLIYTPDFLGLQNTRDIKFAPFYINFQSGKMLYRLKHASVRKELVARAIGLTPQSKPKIIDATAGLGRDSLLLAALGFEVTMIERSAIIHILLEDALTRAQQEPQLEHVIQRLHLIKNDAISYLNSLSVKNYPDVIILDPMYPQRQKSASSRKEMLILQNLLGKDEDADLLLEVALSCAKKRVVIKRPRLAPELLSERKASFSFTGKSSRFDIYLT